MSYRQSWVEFLKRMIAGFDKAARTNPALSSEHAHIHRGEAFGMVFSTDLQHSTSELIQLKTGDKYVHLKDRLYSVEKGEWLLSLWEEPSSLTDGVTPISVHNKNRNSDVVSSVELFSGALNLIGGTMINEMYFNPGDRAQSDGAQTGNDEEEWVLKPNSVYVFKMERLPATGSTALSIYTRWFWYETEVI